MLLWAMSDLSAPSCSELHQSSWKQEVPWHMDFIRGERKSRGTIFNWQRETPQQQPVRQLEGSRALHLHCPQVSRKSEKTWPWQGQQEHSDLGSTPSWKTSNSLLSLSGLGPWTWATGIRTSYFTIFLWGHMYARMQKYLVKLKTTLCCQIMMIFKAFPLVGLEEDWHRSWTLHGISSDGLDWAAVLVSM